MFLPSTVPALMKCSINSKIFPHYGNVYSVNTYMMWTENGNVKINIYGDWAEPSIIIINNNTSNSRIRGCGGKKKKLNNSIDLDNITQSCG